MDDLPQELLDYIFLAVRPSETQLAAVCKTWYESCSIHSLMTKECKNLGKWDDFVALCALQHTLRGYSLEKDILLFLGAGSHFSYHPPKWSVATVVQEFMVANFGAENQRPVGGVYQIIPTLSNKVIVSIARLAFDQSSERVYVTKKRVSKNARRKLHNMCDIIADCFWISHTSFGSSENGFKFMRFAKIGTIWDVL